MRPRLKPTHDLVLTLLSRRLGPHEPARMASGALDVPAGGGNHGVGNLVFGAASGAGQVHRHLVGKDVKGWCVGSAKF